MGKLASRKLARMSRLGGDVACDGECSVDLFGAAGPGAVCWPYFGRILLWYWRRESVLDSGQGGNGV